MFFRASIGYKLEAINGAASSKNRDAIFDVVAAARDCKSTCEVYLPRVMHALNMVRYTVSSHEMVREYARTDEFLYFHGVYFTDRRWGVHARAK